MAITSEQVKRLREKTGAGMMNCKRALEESGGDMEKAIEYLRKKGAATAQKRAGKMAKEGIIVTHVAENKKRGVIVEVNCETDFVARGEDFSMFANTVAKVVEQHHPTATDQLLLLSASGGLKISEMLNDLLAKVGEKVDVRRFMVLDTTNGVIGAYTHMGSKIGVIVEIGGIGSERDGEIFSRDVAMQIAAMDPQYLQRDDVPKEILEHEMDIYRTQARNEGKPDEVVERIAAGKLEKFLQEICLLEQSFIKDAGKTVKELLGSMASIRRFYRYHLGEN